MVSALNIIDTSVKKWSKRVKSVNIIQRFIWVFKPVCSKVSTPSLSSYDNFTDIPT